MEDVGVIVASVSVGIVDGKYEMSENTEKPYKEDDQIMSG